jgi:hypothetical protein
VDIKPSCPFSSDSLYLLVVNANIAVLEGRVERGREYIILLGYLSAEIRGNLMKDRLEILRRVVLMFIEPVIILDAAIAQVVSERLNGQPVLFRDCSVKLEEQVQMAEELSEHFNLLARSVDAAEVSLEELRNNLQSETTGQDPQRNSVAQQQIFDGLSFGMSANRAGVAAFVDLAAF